MSAINRSILWKLIITALVVIWAVSAMIPFSDTPFETYIQTRATANQEEFAKILKAAEARVDKLAAKNDKSKSPTLYIALRDYADAENIDLYKYFPDVNVSDILNLKKRNDILLKELYRQSKGMLKKGLDLQGGVSFTLEIDDTNLDKDQYSREGQLKDVLSVMNNRVNGLGVTEPTIRIMGSKAVEVQMPGVSLKDNPEAIEELSRPAKLEFRLVHRTARPSSAKPPISEIPFGYEVMIMETERNGRLVEEPMYVKRIPEANGDIISRAYPTMEDANKFSVGMEFTSDGAKVFERITRTILEEDNRTGTKQPLAIVLDGRLMSAPNIVSVIKGLDYRQFYAPRSYRACKCPQQSSCSRVEAHFSKRSRAVACRYGEGKFDGCGRNRLCGDYFVYAFFLSRNGVDCGFLRNSEPCYYSRCACEL